MKLIPSGHSSALGKINWTLKLHRCTARESGLYSAKACNRLGQVEKTWSFQVIEVKENAI